MEFSKEKNPTKFKLFSRRYFLVLFFLLFFVITFFPEKNTYAINNDETDRSADITAATKPVTVWEKNGDEECSIGNLPRCFVLIIFYFSGFLLTLSGTVFTWIIDTANIKLILGGTSTSNPLYELWQYVRDILNMAFIMMLLFSAFCTIFQIEQYNYRKTLWKIVLMALLVNFSFPITRFIIDAANILMYSLIKSDLLSTSSFTNIAAGNGALKDLLNPTTFPTTSSLLVATIMIFMLAITLLAVGILLLIRMIALAILIIFSPVAFAGSIIPGVSAQASKWWDNLFKYSFFGPIMIFGIIITVKLMNGIGASLKTAAGSAANAESVEANLIGSVAYMSLPIVLLWVVIGVAQSTSIAGAGAVMGGAKGAMKWAGKTPGKAAWWGIKKTGVPGGVQQKWAQFKKTGRLGSDATEKRAAWVAEKTPYSVKGAINEHARKKANEQRDEWKKTGTPSKEDLEKLLTGGDNIKARAAALELAESTGFDGNYENYKHVVENVMKGDVAGVEMLNEKTKKKGRDLILAYKLNNNKDLKLQDELAKLDNADFGSINFKNLVTNTTNRGHNRGGADGVKSFFTGINANRKIQISRRINKENETYLEDEHLFAAKNQQEEPTKKSEQKSKPAPGTAPGARPGFI